MPRMSPSSTIAFPEVSLVKAPGHGDFVLGPSLACFILVTLLCFALLCSKWFEVEVSGTALSRSCVTWLASILLPPQAVAHCSLNSSTPPNHSHHGPSLLEGALIPGPCNTTSAPRDCHGFLLLLTSRLLLCDL